MTVREVMAETQGSSKTTTRRALGYLRPHKLALLGAGVCILLQTLLGLVPFVIVKALIDHLENPQQGSGKIILLAAAAVGLALANGLVGLVRAWIVLRMTNQISANLRRQLVGALLGQSISYFTGARGGELMSRLLNDVAVTETVLGDTVLTFASNVITAVVFVLAMAVVQWQLAVVTVIIIPPVILALRRPDARSSGRGWICRNAVLRSPCTLRSCSASRGSCWSSPSGASSPSASAAMG